MLVLLLACATITLGPLYDAAAHGPPEAFGPVFAAQPVDELYEDALARREAGDFEGAVHRLSWLAEQGYDSPSVLYQLGIAYEMEEELETAVSVYDLMLSRDTEKEYLLDAGFRRALCLEELGRYEEAYRQYKALPTNRAFDRHDRYTLDIAVGIAALNSGHPREGEELIRTSLMATEGTDEITWMRAKGLVALSAHALEESGELPLSGSDRRIRKHVEARAAAIAMAQENLVQVIALEEPEWILIGLLDLGDAYADLHDDLIAAPPPAKLNADEVQIYTAEVAKRAAIVQRKAWEAYDQGMEVAGRLAMDNNTTRTLQARRDAIQLE